MTLARVAILGERRRRRVRMVRVLAIAVFLLAFPATSCLFAFSASSSGFKDLFVLLFSDARTVFRDASDVLLALMESFPTDEFLLVLVSILVPSALLWFMSPSETGRRVPHRYNVLA